VFGLKISKTARLGLVMALVLIVLPAVFAATYTVCSSACTYTTITACLIAINNTAGNTCSLTEATTYTINDELYFNIIESGSNPVVSFTVNSAVLNCNHSTISGNGGGYGVYMGTDWNLNSRQVRNCRIANYSRAIYANGYYMPPNCGSYSNAISGNTFEQADVYLDCIASSSITNNKFRSAGLTSYAYQAGNGGYLNYNNYIANNDFNSSYGIYLYGMPHNNIIRNNVINSSSYGIYIAQVLPSSPWNNYYPMNTTNATIMNNKINAGTYGIQTSMATYGTIFNNTFRTNSESLYLSSSKYAGISLNNFLVGGVYDNYGNNYCINGEGNFYEKSLTPASGDCGPVSIISPALNVSPYNTNITWIKQSSSLPVTYDVFQTNHSNQMFVASYSPFNYSGIIFNDAYVFADTIGGVDFITAEGQQATTADGILNFDLFLVNDSTNALGLGAGKKITAYGRDFFANGMINCTAFETANGLSPGDCKYFRHNAFLAGGAGSDYIFNDTFNPAYSVISGYTTPPYLNGSIWNAMVSRTTNTYYEGIFTDGETYTIEIIPWINGSRIEATPMSTTFTICPTPGDDYYVNDDTILCQQAYQLNDTGNNGVLIINASDITLDCNGATLIGNSIGKGIDVTYFNNVTIKNCNIYNYTYDIYLYYSNYSTVTDSNLFTNFSQFTSYYGIYGTSSSYAEIIGNEIFVDDDGVYFTGSDNLLIADNSIYSGGNAIQLQNSNASEIFGNSISSNGSDSVHLLYAPNSEIRNNLVYGDLSTMLTEGLSQKGQVYVEQSPFTNIINNTCSFCAGFQFYYSDNSSAINNTITDLSIGLLGLLISEYSDNVLFQDNNMTNTMGLLGAFRIQYSANVTVKENIVANNFIAFMSVQDSSDILVANNTMISTSDAWYIKNVSELADDIMGLNYTGPGAQIPFIIMMFEQLIPLLGGGTFNVTGGNITGLNADLAALMGGGVLGPLFYANSERVDFIDNVVRYSDFKLSVPMNTSTVDIKNNVLSANIGVGMFEIDDSTIKNNLFVLNNSGLFVEVSGNRLNLVNNSANMGFIGTVVSGDNNLFFNNNIIMDNVAVDFTLNSNFSQIENLSVGGTVYGLGISGANTTVQNNRININDVGLYVKVYGNATEFSNVNITPLNVGLLALSSAGNSMIFNNTGSISSSGILLGMHPDVSADIQHLVFSDAVATAILVMDSDSNTIMQNRFAISDVGINASVSNENINDVESKNLTFASLIVKSGSAGNQIINNSFTNSSLPFLAFDWNPNKAANSSIFVEVYGAAISSDSPGNYLAHNNFKNIITDTSALTSAFGASLNNIVLVEKAGIMVESANNTIYANTFYNPDSGDALVFGENNTFLLNHFLSGGVSGSSSHYASYSPLYYNGEYFNDTYGFVIPSPLSVQAVTGDNTQITSADGTNSYDLFLFNDTNDALGQGNGKMSTMLCTGCYALGITSCSALESATGMSPGECRYYKQNAFNSGGMASNYSWTDTFNSSYYVISGNPTPPYLAAKTSVALLNTFCVNGEGNFYEQDLTPLEGDCGPANITTFAVGGGATNVFWQNQSAHSLVTYDVLVNNTATGDVYLLGSTTATNFSIDTSTYDSSFFSIELVPWVTGSRFNGTHVFSPMFMPGIMITYPAAGATVNGTVTITFIGTNMTPEISFDGGNWTPTTGVNSHIWETRNFTIGTHMLQIREFRGTGFIYSKTVLVNVGASAPLSLNLTLMVYDEGDWSNHNTSLYAYWTTNQTGNFTYNYTLTDDTASSIIVNMTSAGANMSVNATGLALASNHSYTFFVIMYNETNYQVANASSDGIKVDFTPPASTLSSSTHPNENATYFSTVAAFSWTASDTPSGLYGFSYIVDANPLTMPDDAIELPATATSLTLTVPSGTSYLHFKTLDKAGNYVIRHFKLTVVAAGAVNVLLYPHASPTNKDLIDLKGTVSQNVTSMTLFVNGIANNVTAELKLVDLEFEFNNVSIPAGINAIYAVAYINSTAVGTSNTIYVKRISSARTNVTELTIECSACGSASSRIIYATASNPIPDTSRYPKYGAGTDTSGTPVAGGKVTGTAGSETFIFVTKPEAPLAERNSLLEDRELFDKISPSMGFLLDPEEYQISIMLNYADLLILGEDKVQEGRFNLVVKNNGMVNGVPNISVEII
jgi:parallel beta-helix repeat protein